MSAYAQTPAAQKELFLSPITFKPETDTNSQTRPLDSVPCSNLLVHYKTLT